MKKAFTLAEVLITLGIIGVVAAMTMPVLMAKHKKIVLANQLKKAYAEVNLMIKQSETVNGPIQHWEGFDTATPRHLKTTEKTVEEKIMPFVSGAIMYKGTTSDAGYPYGLCYDGRSIVQTDRNGALGQHVWLNNVFVTTPVIGRTVSLALKDGVCVGFIPVTDDYFIADIAIDVNGVFKKPNMVGKDLFFFKLANDGRIMPYGYDWKYEDLTSGKAQSCNSSQQTSSGYACAAKVMADGWTFKNDYPW